MIASKSLMLLLFITLVCGFGCRKHDIRTVVVEVPGMRAPACAKIIQEAFMTQPGIRSVQPDFQQRTLTITYDSMIIALKNMEFAIAAAGFDANDVRACPEAAERLPPECREE